MRAAPERFRYARRAESRLERTTPSGDPVLVPQTSSVIKPAVRWALCGFMFVLLFETASIGLSVKPTLIFGALLMLAAFSQPAICFRRPPAAFWLFAAYLYFGMVGNVLSRTATRPDVLYQYFVYVQLLILFWITYNLFRYDGMPQRALLSLALSASIVAVLTLSGITHKTYDTGLASQRVSAFDSDPNNLAGLLALAFIGLVGITWAKGRPLLRSKLIAGALAALIALFVLQTGSRGAMVALVVGVMALSQSIGSASTRIRTFLVAAVLVGTFVVVGYNTPTIRLRFERTLQTGSMAKREEIYPLAFQLFLKRPIFGWGVVTNTAQLASRLDAEGLMPPLTAPNGSYFKATHNMILYVLSASGIMGTLPFLIGLWLCLRSAWKARRGSQGFLPFALALTVLLLDMSVDGHHWKQHWIFMAYALASGQLVMVRGKRAAIVPESAAIDSVPQRSRSHPGLAV